MKLFKSIIINLVVLVFVAICLGNQVISKELVKGDQSKNELFEKYALFATVLSIIQNSYVDDIASKDLIYGALEGTLASLDPFSAFLSPEDYKKIQIDTEGQFGGLGMEVSIKDEALTIITPIPGTPAFHAGLKSGDKIIKVNGDTIDASSLSKTVAKLRGPINSKVEVTIFRPSDKTIFSVEMIREKIKLTSITKELLLPDTEIGYIKISKFHEGTSKEFKKSLKELEKQKIKGLILDLRNNPGGLLDEAIKVAGILIGGGKKIVYTKGRLPEQNIEKISDKKYTPINYHLVILINNGSASSSEIVTGAVQDWKGGIILGEQSFGKASVQSLIPLKDGSALKLTTAKYYTPKGRGIHNIGIEPDVKVSLTKEDLVLMAQKLKDIYAGKIETEKNSVYKDNQISSAINVINGLGVYSKAVVETDSKKPLVNNQETPIADNK